MQNRTKVIAALLSGAMALSLAGCGQKMSTPISGTQDNGGDAIHIDLSNDVSVNGQAVGTDPDEAVYLSHDIIYYEDRDSYDSGNVYGEGGVKERHSVDEAAAHTVVNITQPGAYWLSGKLEKGQIRVDLGEEAREDPNATVSLVLNGVDITCEVAPAILIRNVYECDNQWRTDSADSSVDTTNAGAWLILADGSENKISGSHVAKIYEDSQEEEKLWKQDGAIYSYMSMVVDGQAQGNGVLDLTADNEGLDTELHLTINGGKINIRSQNDGINTNEDGVSVTTINGGELHIIAGLGTEGDGIDSNGWLVINGGTVVSSANPAADAGLDSDMGSFVNGGTVVALGSTMDWAESDSEQVTMNLQFADFQTSGDAIVATDLEGKIVFAYDPSEDEVLVENVRNYQGAVISSPSFRVGDSYHVYIGGTMTGEEHAGVYDVSAVTAYENGVQQQYTGTDVRRGPGGMPGMGGRPSDKFQNGDAPETPPEIPENFEPESMVGERREPP